MQVREYIYMKYLTIRNTLYRLAQIMQRKRSTKYFCSHDEAQPWDSYVTGTTSTSNDQGDEKPPRRPKR